MPAVIVPAAGTTYSRVEPGGEGMCTVADDGPVCGVPCQTVAVPVAAAELETYIMVICTELDGGKDLRMPRGKTGKLFIPCIFICQP